MVKKSSSRNKLKRQSARGGVVTIIGQGLNILLQLAGTIILARFLSPNDYGIIGMVTAVTAFAGLFRDLGLSSAVIQRKELTLIQHSNLFWLNVLLGLSLTVCVAISAPLVASFYGNDDLKIVTVALSLNFLIGSIGTQPAAKLVREMRFFQRIAANVVGNIVTLIVSLLLAINDYSYWSLVIAGISGNIITTIMLVRFSPMKIMLPTSDKSLGEILKFGASVTGFDLANYFHRNMDNVLIGKVWGTVELGFYNRGYQLLMLPISAIRNPINAVAFPTLSKIQDSPMEYRAYFRKMVNVLAFVSMPVTAFLFVRSKEIVELALGPKWGEVTPLFSVLALTAFIQPVASLRGVVMLSLGNRKRYLIWGIVNAVVVVTGFSIGIMWGAIGVAWSYAISYYILLPISLFLCFGETCVKHRDFYIPLMRPAFWSLISAILVMICSDSFFLSSSLVIVALSAFLYALLFIGIYLLVPGGMHELKSLIRIRQYLTK